MNHFIKALLMLLIGAVPVTWAFDPGLSGYTIKTGPWQSEYKTMSLFVLPAHKFSFRVEQNGKPLLFDVALANAPLTNPLLLSSVKQAEWVAPKIPGIYRAQFVPKSVSSAEKLEPSELLIFVMHAKSEVIKGKLNGYTIGEYPKKALNGLAIYEPPKGFVEVTKENQDTFISPHYQLKQFLCKQNQGFPKYVVLQTRLLRKLEFFTQAVNERGIATEGFTIMSGYRTPFYNSAIKNKTNDPATANSLIPTPINPNILSPTNKNPTKISKDADAVRSG